MMSVKDMMVQKKAKKRAKEANKLANKMIKLGRCGHTENREKNAVLRTAQAANLADMAMQIGLDVFPDAVIAKDAAQRETMLNNLIYNKNIIEALDFFHAEILVMKYFSVLVNAIPNGSGGGFWAKVADDAVDCLRTLNQTWEYSPNQRRQHFEPIRKLVGALNAAQKVMPESIGNIIADYCTAVVMSDAMIKLYKHNEPQVVDSLFRIIQGDSLRQCAKFHKIKEPELREKILSAAINLWKVVNCYKTLPIPYAIPALRSKEWREYSDLNFVQSIVKATSEKLMIPLETKTGVSLIEFNRLKRDLIEIEAKFY